MRLLILGDTHGNSTWIRTYAYPTAARIGADTIVQLGDFGYWEHQRQGAAFLDQIADLAHEYRLPLHWLHGNHDKHSLALDKYAANVTKDGFLSCRPGVNYIPNGHIWEWAGVRMRAFGGAYSVDKEWRLEQEAAKRNNIEYANRHRTRAGRPLVDPDTTGLLWFPEEEMSDLDMAALLAADSGPLDVVFSHDKPRSANPGWNRKDFEECLPNQDRLQHALLAHHPFWWFHGHLHYAYETIVRSGDDDTHTVVVGLAPDNDAVENGNWRRTDSWCVLDLDPDNGVNMTSGAEIMYRLKKEN